MTHDPMALKGDWPLLETPSRVPWWRKWRWWWPKVGELSLEAGQIRGTHEGRRFVYDLHNKVGVQLNVWPIDDKRCWLGVTLSQNNAQFDVQIAQPWSAVPAEMPVLMMRAPLLDDDAFATIWTALRFAESLRGNMLPEIKPGLYSSSARHTGLLKPMPAPRPKDPKPSGEHPMPKSRNREAIKAFVRTYGPGHWVLCPFCKVPAMSHNLIMHCDRVHGLKK